MKITIRTNRYFMGKIVEFNEKIKVNILHRSARLNRSII